MPPAAPAPARIPLLTAMLQIAGLSALGVAQPLLQLVRQNPEFLVVHDTGPWDVAVMVAVLFLLPPAILTVPVALLGAVGVRAGRTALALVLGALLFLVLLPVADRIPVAGGWASLVVAALPALALTLGYGRFRALRQNLTLLAAAVPLLATLFLASGPVWDILTPEAPPPIAAGVATDPVVLIVFDEFPVTSLMDPHEQLDRRMFPNFGRLADSATWFPNATTISPATLRSVPAILSGRYPDWEDAPSLATYPDNIFTMLGASHRVTVREPLTDLCPPELVAQVVPGFAARLDLLFEDLIVLYQHVVVPGRWRGALVPVSDKWGHYRRTPGDPASDGGAPNLMAAFEEFIASIGTGERPDLAVAHVMLPHVPFHFLPDGQVYNRRKRIPVLPDGTWGPDRLAMAHSYRRHLLQVVAVDRLVGRLLDRLEECGRLEETAIVITSDHGAAWRTGRHRRRYDGDNLADIMGVPLFFKAPGQTVGAIDHRHVQTIDIMPSLAGALQVPGHGPYGGFDFLAERERDRAEIDFLDQDTKQHHRFAPAVLAGRQETLRWKHELFGDEGGCERLYAMGDPGGRWGAAVDDASIADHPVLRARIYDRDLLETIDLRAPFVPAEINGVLTGHTGEPAPALALALNGRLVGFTAPYLESPEPQSVAWQVLAPLASLRNGANEVALYQVDERAGPAGLVRIPLVLPSFIGTNLGGTRVCGIRERGLYKTHMWDGVPSRWTDGGGTWGIPLKEGEEPQVLEIAIVSSGPAGNALTVTVNGLELLRQELPRGAWTTRLPLDGVAAGDELTVVLSSGTFVPSASNPESNDHRELGVAVTNLIVE